MRYRVILIIGLLALCLIAPAAAYRVDPVDVTYSEDNNGNPRAVAVHIQDVSEWNSSDKFSPYKYPSDKYKFILVNYSLINPTSSDVSYEFNISLQDQANRKFYTDNFIVGENVPANGKLDNRQKAFAVYRNSTTLQIFWTDKETIPPWDHYDTVIDIHFQDPAPAPTATPLPTATPTATPTPTPAPTGGCLSFLPLGLIIGSVGCVGLLTRKYRSGR
jgi:hypothetical protein